MFINEVCKTCALTKKAVEYYIAQGLVAPSVQENGYRDFSDADIERLKKISVLRGLGISAAELQKILSVQQEMGNAALKAISDRKRMEIAVMQEKRQLLQELSSTQDWDLVQEKLRQPCGLTKNFNRLNAALLQHSEKSVFTPAFGHHGT